MASSAEMQAYSTQKHSKSAVTTASQRFKQTLCELFAMLEDIITSIHAGKLSSVTPDAVRFTSLLVSAYDSNVMMESFISHHNHWEHILNHNRQYVMVEFDEMLKDNGIVADTSIIKTPFSVHASLIANPGIFGSNRDTWPVIDDDLEAIWSYFESLIGIACSHIHSRIKSPSVPPHYRQINISRYSKALGFELRD